MSSKEIAELTGKRHDHITRDIKHMFSELKKSHSPFLGDELSERGKIYCVFYLPKEETLILISGYNIKMRAKIIKRWIELEEKENVMSLPQSFSEALQLAADQAKQLEEQKPQVEFAEAIEGSTDKILLGQFAKASGLIGQNKLFSLLRQKGIFFKKSGVNFPYQAYVNNKNFEVVERIANNKIRFTTYITGKGQLWLTKKIKEWV
ncbi:MAG: DNA-binding protein [archaeon]|nr:DNA-binding protein [archaeon]